MEQREVSYKKLYANWFEYTKYCNEWPFMKEFQAARFKDWLPRNKLVLDLMLNRRKSLIEAFVKVNTDKGEYLVEKHEGKERYQMIDETRRAEFDELFKKWEDTTVVANY